MCAHEGQWRVNDAKFKKCNEIHLIGQGLTDEEVEGLAHALQYSDHVYVSILSRRLNPQRYCVGRLTL